MAEGKQLHELTPATQALDDDLMLLQQNGIAKSITLRQLLARQVKFVNGIAPDENGNVVVEGGGASVYVQEEEPSNAPVGTLWYDTDEESSGGVSGGSGEPGADGFSPVATVTQTGSGAVISVTDKSGTTTATVFNGKDGEKGDKGDPGEKGDTGAPGADGAKGDKGDKGDTGAQGNPGKDGADGKDGVSATHSWNGTTLIITSASGTSSANLKGEKGDQGIQGIQGIQGVPGDKGDKGDKGDTGAPGSNGTNGTSVTVKSVSESTADGGSNVVTFSDGKTVTIKNGSKGSKGDAYTLNDTDKATIVNAVIAALPVYAGEVV